MVAKYRSTDWAVIVRTASSRAKACCRSESAA